MLRLRDAEWEKAWKRRLVNFMVVGVLVQKVVSQNGTNFKLFFSREGQNSGDVIQEVPVVGGGTG